MVNWIGSAYCQKCSLIGWDWCHCPKPDNSFQLLEALEGQYIFTQTSAYRPIESGFVKIFKPVYDNRVIIGVCPIEISLLQHCTRNELQQLLQQSIGQVEYEAWYNDRLKAYERIANGNY